MEVEDYFRELCTGMSIEELEKLKQQGNENVKKANIKPGKITKLFNKIVDVQIRALKTGDDRQFSSVK